MSTIQKVKEVRKFDSGGKGFKRAAYVLVIGAFVLLALGVYLIQDLLKARELI